MKKAILKIEKTNPGIHNDVISISDLFWGKQSRHEKH
jgi:hypothetical protein